MLGWAQQHVGLINATMNGLMVLIWLVYLHIFLVSYLRQNRAVIHVDRGSARDERGRCVVTNMGSETIYLLGIVVDLVSEDTRERCAVTERDEIELGDQETSLKRTNQGPLPPGEERDVGSFEDLAARASRRTGRTIDVTTYYSIVVTVVAASDQARHLVAAYKRFDVTRDGGGTRFVPGRILTRQIRSRWHQRRLEDLLVEAAS